MEVWDIIGERIFWEKTFLFAPQFISQTYANWVPVPELMKSQLVCAQASPFNQENLHCNHQQDTLNVQSLLCSYPGQREGREEEGRARQGRREGKKGRREGGGKRKEKGRDYRKPFIVPHFNCFVLSLFSTTDRA